MTHSFVAAMVQRVRAESRGALASCMAVRTMAHTPLRSPAPAAQWLAHNAVRPATIRHVSALLWACANLK